MAKRRSRPQTPGESDAPDPSNVYERAHPEREAGMGNLDNNVATPTNRPDQQQRAVKNKQQPNRVITGQDNVNARASASPAQQPQPDHSMHEEEPLGWDQAPTDIKNPRAKRHPRKEGKGGVK